MEDYFEYIVLLFDKYPVCCTGVCKNGSRCKIKCFRQRCKKHKHQLWTCYDTSDLKYTNKFLYSLLL